MSNPKPLFHIDLPKGIHLAECKLELFVECGERLDGLMVEILDEGGGAFLRLTTDGVSLDPEELEALTKTMLAGCKFIDGGKK